MAAVILIMTILKVKISEEIEYPSNHPKAAEIQKWIDAGLSPGYVEYLLENGNDPHCSACRDSGCNNFGRGDDACPAYKYGEKW